MIGQELNDMTTPTDHYCCFDFMVGVGESIDLAAIFILILTKQLFVLQAFSSSSQVVFAEGVRAEKVTQAGGWQLLLQVVEQFFCHLPMDRQTNQRQVI